MQRLYAISGIVAGVMILIVCALITAQIVARPLGIVLPGADEFAVGAFVAAIFLGLPYTLSTNGHVRADVAVQLLGPKWRRSLEILVHLVAIAFVAFFIYFAADLAWNSYLRNARFQGLLGSPVWIPQLAMMIGLVLLELGLIHSLARTIRGGSENSGESTPAEYGQ